MEGEERVRRTKRVMAREKRTRMKRNLKKWAASFARPAIQYVLNKKKTSERENQKFNWNAHGSNDDGGYEA